MTTKEQELEEALVRLDEAWSQLFRRITSDIKEYPFSIPLAQVHVLGMLDKMGPHRMTDLAERMDVTQSACTALVERTVQAGLVARHRDPEDRRVVWAELTPEGNRTLDEMRRVRAKILAKYLNRLEPEEIQLLASLLSRTVDAILAEDAQVEKIVPGE